MTASTYPLLSVAPLVATLASCLEAMIIAGDHANRGRPALETIEAMALGPTLDGRIARSRASPEVRGSPKCPECRRRRARPMAQRDACDARLTFQRAGIDEAIAYAFVKTTVLVIASKRLRMCRCDLIAWARAIEEYQRSGPAAWRSIGVDP